MEHIVVGLGNPGKEYEKTRHNIGRVVLEVLREKNEFSAWELDKYAKSLRARGGVAGADTMLVEPDNYMNNSGEAVKYFVKSPEEMERLIVVHDDLYLPVGEIKISYGKGDGGHNGIRSIVQHMGSKNFTRVRIGIAQKNFFGKMRAPRDRSKFVLGEFSEKERTALKAVLVKAARAIEIIIKEGREAAANKYN